MVSEEGVPLSVEVAARTWPCMRKCVENRGPLRGGHAPIHLLTLCAATKPDLVDLRVGLDVFIDVGEALLVVVHEIGVRLRGRDA